MAIRANPAMIGDSNSLLRTKRRVGEFLIRSALLLCAVVSILTTFGIIGSLAAESFEFFKIVSLREFFTGTQWAPEFAPRSFGVLPLLWGTLYISLIGAAIAFPVGLGIAIYLSEYARRRVRKILKPLLEILAGIPTVVFGYFALTFVTPNLVQKLIPSTQTFNAFTAGIVLGIMIIPTIASISEDAMRAVPRSLREGAYGMGATRRVVATKVIVPAALSGIAAALILGISRAIGETMIVAIASGGNPNLTIDARQSMQTITAFIVQVSLGDTPVGSISYRTIFALGTTLFAMTLILNVISSRIARRFREKYE